MNRYKIEKNMPQDLSQNERNLIKLQGMEASLNGQSVSFSQKIEGDHPNQSLMGSPTKLQRLLTGGTAAMIAAMLGVATFIPSITLATMPNEETQGGFLLEMNVESNSQATMDLFQLSKNLLKDTTLSPREIESKAQQLIKEGADVNAKDNCWQTGLSYAIANACNECSCVCLEKERGKLVYKTKLPENASRRIMDSKIIPMLLGAGANTKIRRANMSISIFETNLMCHLVTYLAGGPYMGDLKEILKKATVETIVQEWRFSLLNMLIGNMVYDSLGGEFRDVSPEIREIFAEILRFLTEEHPDCEKIKEYAEKLRMKNY
jgi:hypothetical protein